MKFESNINRRPWWMAFWMAAAATFAIGAVSSSIQFATASPEGEVFKRVSTFLVCSQIDPDCNTDVETVAETVWYFTMGADDEKTCLVYTDSEQENLGFVDVTDPANPTAEGTVALGGEPTTVRVIGKYGTWKRRILLCIGIGNRK